MIKMKMFEKDYNDHIMDSFYLLYGNIKAIIRFRWKEINILKHIRIYIKNIYMEGHIPSEDIFPQNLQCNTLANWYHKVPWNQNWRVAKQGQAGLSGANRGQTGPNGAKWCQTESNGAKWGQTGQNEAKTPYGAKRGQKSQTRPNGVILGWFFACTHIFMRLKSIV